MARNNRNNAEREAAKAASARENTSHIKAIYKVGHHRPSGISAFDRSARRSAKKVAKVVQTLDPAGWDVLKEKLIDIVGYAEVDEFTPFDLVEGDMEEVLLLGVTPAPTEPQVVDAQLASSGGPPIWAVHWVVEGAGEISWCVHAPTADDEASFDKIDPDADGPGVVQELESATPIRIHGWALWDPSTRQWAELEVQFVGMPDEEVRERSRRHSREEVRRLQAVGLLPSDDWIGEHAYPLWSAMDREPRRAVSTLTREDVPTGPGAYAIYRGSEPVYLGKATSLRRRIWANHLGRGARMGDSAFRRNVAEHLGIASAADIKAGNHRPSEVDLERVRAFIEECAVAWLECDTPAAAEDLEEAMKAEMLPALTKR